MPGERCPEQGDLVWLDFDPRAGHEQGGHRPALILSPRRYNSKVGLALACPITTRGKGFPWETPLPAGLPIEGFVLADHIRNVDWRARGAATHRSCTRVACGSSHGQIADGSGSRVLGQTRGERDDQRARFFLANPRAFR